MFRLGKTGKISLVLRGHSKAVTAISLPNDIRSGKFLSVSRDRVMHQWDLAKSTTIRAYKGHESWITNLKSLDRNRIVTASNDQSLRLWDLRVHNCVNRINYHKSSITAIQVSL